MLEVSCHTKKYQASNSKGFFHSELDHTPLGAINTPQLQGRIRGRDFGSKWGQEYLINMRKSSNLDHEPPEKIGVKRENIWVATT